MAAARKMIVLFIMMSLFGIASAELGDYGVVVGTVNYDTITDISTTKSPHLEPQQTEGKYPHYMFYVNTPEGQYQCVIDIFSRTNNNAQQQSINYRVVPLDAGNQDWTTVLNLADGYHQLPRDSSHGALDYFRHPGVNKDAMTLPWQWDSNFVVGANLPTFDNLFKNVQRVWVFGQPYTYGGLGIHNIHQNQGNVPNNVLQAPQGPNGDDHSDANGLWQDGGVILEYPPIIKWVPGFFKKCAPNYSYPYIKYGNIFGGIFEHIEFVPHRVLLMTKFQVQEDFTFDSYATQDGYNFKPGDGYAPLYLFDFRIGGIDAQNPTSIPAGGFMEGQHSSTTGLTKKISIKVMPKSGHPVLYGRIGTAPTQTQYDAKSDQPIGKIETIHAYSATPQRWYWRVYNLDSGPSTFTWEEFDDSY